MRILTLPALIFFSTFIAHASEELKIAGKISVLEGEAYQQAGEIHFSRPSSGEKVKVNAFGQYRDEYPTAAYIEWSHFQNKPLETGGVVYQGNILKTGTDGRVKLLMKDNSILELGPHSVLEIVRYQDDNEKVYLKLMLGKLHLVVNQKLKSATDYQIATPDSLLGVRGTEFFVFVESPKKSLTTTEVVCTHGQVSIDIAKFNKKGLLYYYPYVVNPGSQFINHGVRGLSKESSLANLPASQVRKRISEISPGVNTWSSGSIRANNDHYLPGTARFRVQPGRAIASTDNRSTKISNFKLPSDFEIEKRGIQKNLMHLPYLGAPPVSFLPGDTSRVEISIEN